MLLLTVLLPVLAGLAIAVDGTGSSSDPDTANDQNPTQTNDESSGTTTADDGSEISVPTIEDVALSDGTETEATAEDTSQPREATEVTTFPVGIEGENIEGTGGDDTLLGTLNDDTLSGLGGNDRIEANLGSDLLSGGDGNDTLLGQAGTDILAGDAGDDEVKGGKGDDFLFGGVGDDRLIGGPGDDLVSDEEGADYLRGDQGDDVLFSVDGLDAPGMADTVEGGIGNDRLTGDDGDILSGGEGVNRFEVVVGGAPVTITDFNLFHPPGSELDADLLTLVNQDGSLISRAEILENGGRLVDREDGTGTDVYYDGLHVAIIEGYTRDDLVTDSHWLGNFAPELTGRLDGDDLLLGDQISDGQADHLSGGLGDDTLVGGNGADFLQGGLGDDLLDSIDQNEATEAADTVIGGDGDDVLRADNGDSIGGQDGTDSYEIVVPESDTDAPVEIYGYEFETSDQLIEHVTFIDGDGNALSTEDLLANAVVHQDANGVDTVVEYNGRVALILHGVDADLLVDPTLWVGNFDPDPVSPGIPLGSVTSDAEQMNMSIQSFAGTGNVVSQEMFGANAVFSVNTEQGVPLENYVEGARALDVLHFRFPAGQGDSLDGENEGIDWLNVIDLEENAEGELVLREEVTNALDAAIAAHNNGNDVKVTMVIPTKLYTVEEYEALYNDIARFAEIMVTEYADEVETIEIGNEYWAIGETAYGQKADIAARALAEGMERAGVTGDEQPDIIVQMATPNEGSEFHSSVDDRGFGERRDDANQQIIDQLSDEARDAIDGVVEHYYYRRDYDEFTGDGNEQGFIPNDYDIWEANFDKELNLHITEWNIRTTNVEQNGIRAAGILPEMMEYMVSWGTDAAHGWPVVHNTTSHLAGTRTDMPVLDENGWVVNSVRGAVYDLMSEELVGTELLETAFSNEDGRMEIQAYRDDGKVVVQVSSRTDEAVDLDLDLTSLVSGFESAYGHQVGYDRSQGSSDGVYRYQGEVYAAEQTFIDGAPYYFNEFDTRATVTELEVNRSTLTLSLNPYEMAQLVFEFGDGEGSGPPPPNESGRVIEGTEGVDVFLGGGGADLILGFGGNDDLDGLDGADTLYGGDGDDRLVGGTGEDSLFGDNGNDTLYGYGGDDSLKGLDGDDKINGNQGNDTLLGSEGNDSLVGGDGNDTINGGKGSDTLRGGLHRDTLTGWAGSDVFSFEGEDMADGDIITDFEVGKDQIAFAYEDIQSLDDLSISQVEQGIVIYVGDHGGILLQGELTLAQVADPRNFLFT